MKTKVNQSKIHFLKSESNACLYKVNPGICKFFPLIYSFKTYGTGYFSKQQNETCYFCGMTLDAIFNAQVSKLYNLISLFLRDPAYLRNRNFNFQNAYNFWLLVVTKRKLEPRAFQSGSKNFQT